MKTIHILEQEYYPVYEEQDQESPSYLIPPGSSYTIEIDEDDLELYRQSMKLFSLWQERIEKLVAFGISCSTCKKSWPDNTTVKFRLPFLADRDMAWATGYYSCDPCFERVWAGEW